LSDSPLKRILLLVQTPPPFHGQAIMQKYIVDAEWLWCKKEHIRLEYSDTISQVGHFQFSKIGKLLKILAKVFHAARKHRVDVLYYPPAGPNRIPLYRDIITLLFAKLFTKRVILHFHAGGLPELIRRLNLIEKFFAKWAFKNIDCAIVLLPWLKHEVDWFSPKRISVVPNGIEDVSSKYAIERNKRTLTSTKVLFVGNLKDEKGIFTLLASAVVLKSQQLDFQIRIMGEAHSEQVKQEILNFIAINKISENIALLGGLTGDRKWEEFCSADIFCLPTYATEAMPVSILEAMMFSLPVVSTRWRGIPDMITEGEEGYLTPVRDAGLLADKLAQLIKDPDERATLGKKARKRYEQFYTIDKHLSEVEKVFRGSLGFA